MLSSLFNSEATQIEKRVCAAGVLACDLDEGKLSTTNTLHYVQSKERRYTYVVGGATQQPDTRSEQYPFMHVSITIITMENKPKTRRSRRIDCKPSSRLSSTGSENMGI